MLLFGGGLIGGLGKGKDWKNIVASENFMLAQKKDGTWWGFGANFMNPMGFDLEDKHVSSQNTMITEWKQLPDSFDPWATGLGFRTSLILTRDGRLWSSGEIIGSKKTKPSWNQIANRVNGTIRMPMLPVRAPHHDSGFRNIWTWEPK